MTVLQFYHYSNRTQISSLPFGDPDLDRDLDKELENDSDLVLDLGLGDLGNDLERLLDLPLSGKRSLDHDLERDLERVLDLGLNGLLPGASIRTVVAAAVSPRWIAVIFPPSVCRVSPPSVISVKYINIYYYSARRVISKTKLNYRHGRND